MLATVVLCALLPGAPGPVYLGVAPRSPDLDVLAERAAIALGQTLEKRGATDLGSPPLPSVDDVADATMGSAVAGAKAKYQEGDFAAALEKCTEAIERFEGSAAFRPGPSWRAYGDALVLRALALRRLGKEAEADQALTLLLTTQPDVAPDPGMTPPKVTARYDALKSELRSKARVQIEIASEPPGAEVVVDGRVAGKAPLVVRDLLPGTHFVGLSADGVRVDKKVVVTSGTARVDEKVGDPRAGVARAVREAIGAPVNLETLAKKARDAGDDVMVGALLPDDKGPLLIVARIRGDQVVVAGTRVESKGSALKNRVDALSDALLAAREGWLGPAPPNGGLTPAKMLAEGPGAHVANGDVPPPPPPEGDVDGTVWVLVGVGAGVAALLAGAGVIAFVINQNAQNELKVLVDASAL